MTPALDPLKSRQLLSTAVMPAHHHDAMRPHHAAAVGRAHAGHHRATGAAIPDTSTTFTMVAQFNASFSATVAIADNDIWAVGYSTSSGTQQPFAAHFNGTSWSAVPTPVLAHGGTFSDMAAAAGNDVWAIGYQNVGSSINALIEHWDGTSFKVVPSPDPKPNATLRLQGIAAISTSDIWATGSTGIEHWDGSSWSLVSAPGGAGVTALGDGTVVVVSGGTILEN
jgi:hypothetical protein